MSAFKMHVLKSLHPLICTFYKLIKKLKYFRSLAFPPSTCSYHGGFVGCRGHGEFFKRLHPGGTWSLSPSGQAPREGHTIVVSVGRTQKVLMTSSQLLPSLRLLLFPVRKAFQLEAEYGRGLGPRSGLVLRFHISAMAQLSYPWHAPPHSFPALPFLSCRRELNPVLGPCCGRGGSSYPQAEHGMEPSGRYDLLLRMGHWEEAGHFPVTNH